MNWEGDLQEFKLEIEIWPYEQMLFVQENKMHEILWDFKIQMNQHISARPPIVLINKKRTHDLVDFAVLADHRMKIEKSEKQNNYLDVEHKKQFWNMKVMVITIVVRALRTIFKKLERDRGSRSQRKNRDS